MTGFGGAEPPAARWPTCSSTPTSSSSPAAARADAGRPLAAPAAIGDVTYRDTAELDAECALVADAPFAETFMTAASPGIVAAAMENQHYPSTGGVRAAPSPPRCAPSTVAIVDRGLLLQIDAPDLAMERHTLFAERPLAEFLDWVALVVDAINGALDGIDPSRVRLHVCWGNYEGPHTHDVAARRDPAAALQGARRRARALDGQRPPRPRAPLLRAAPLPDAWCSSPASSTRRTTTSSTPRSSPTGCDRRRRVGDPRRVIAGTDCGFDTSAGIGDVAPSVVWEKLRSLRAGADLASARLYGGAA